MSRTFRQKPIKFPRFVYDCFSEKDWTRDGFSSKLSPSKEWKRYYNQRFRNRQKRHLKQGKPFDLYRKSHIWHWW